MKTILFNLKMLLLAIVSFILWGKTNAQNTGAIPELVFTKAKLIAGSSNKDGATYRFSNVASGIDATVKVVSRSAANVVLDTIDLAPENGNGFEKSFQPQLGIHGTVPANSSWWMKFQLSFFKAGTSTPVSIDKFTLTALDVDGDGSTIAENVQMYKATAVTLAPLSVLTKPLTSALSCPKCNKLALPIPCLKCLGTGEEANGPGKTKPCGTCDGTGLVFALCNHAWAGSDMYVPGTTANAGGIDTSASKNMATFTYNNTSSITFDYGAKTGNRSTTAGQRLNSMWFKSFNLKSTQLLPLTLSNFTATYQNKEVNLAWTGSNATNFSHFILERSTDGKTYKDWAVIFSPENNSASVDYSYKDKSLDEVAEIVYYRLKMVDVDESFKYSDVRVVRITDKINSSISIQAYPNPSTDQLLITMPAAWLGSRGYASVHNASGVMVKTIQFPSINQTERVDVSQLLKGLYIINVTSNNVTVQTKMLKN